jgi:hypothetical protein
MGRGEHPWKNHHKNVQIPKIQISNSTQVDWDLEFIIWNLIMSYWEMLEGVSDIFIFRK